MREVVIWVPAGSNRPYKAPDDVTAKHKTYNYRIRQFSSSIVPNSEQEAELVQLTAKIPFDDRVNSSAKIDDLTIDDLRIFLVSYGLTIVDHYLLYGQYDGLTPSPVFLTP